MEEDEDRDNGKVFTVEAETKPSVEEPKVDVNQIVEACMKQMQTLQPNKGQSERLRSASEKAQVLVLWGRRTYAERISSDSAE